MFKCSECLEYDKIQFSSINITDWLSCKVKLRFKTNSWDSTYKGRHDTFGKHSAAPTNSVSVELFVLSFFWQMHRLEYHVPSWTLHSSYDNTCSMCSVNNINNHTQVGVTKTWKLVNRLICIEYQSSEFSTIFFRINDDSLGEEIHGRFEISSPSLRDAHNEHEWTMELFPSVFILCWWFGSTFLK